MSGKKRQKTERRVQRMYEPDRLSVERLIDAYERLVARQVRVIKSDIEPAPSQKPSPTYEQKRSVK
jgi:hypothetical protein